MLLRLYAHNFRCFENFEFKPADIRSGLLIGRNGSGKSSVARVLQVLQKIGRGVNRVGQLVGIKDFPFGRSALPMRFEFGLKLGSQLFEYTLALELPERFKELRVLEERLTVDGNTVYSRERAQVSLHRDSAATGGVRFNIDWHMVALLVIQDPTMQDDLATVKEWLARMVILAPIPKLMTGNSTIESLEPDEDGSNVADWMFGLLAQFPSAYATLIDQLRAVMPDLAALRNVPVSRAVKAMFVQFESGADRFEIGFDDLSDGEKCFFLCALVLAANEVSGPLFVFWDEPDNYLSLSEVAQFIVNLRKGFQRGGQFLATSHNSEAIQRFSSENTWLMIRKTHLEPTQMRRLDELPPPPDLVQALVCGELDGR